jgi:adenylosuccinate synthase
MKEKEKVDVLTSKYDIIARFQGGPNAGHTLEFDGIKHVLRTIPSGIFKTAVNVLKWGSYRSCCF